eukprot:1172907-Pleurochrysis_carterae.AAC.1
MGAAQHASQVRVRSTCPHRRCARAPVHIPQVCTCAPARIARACVRTCMRRGCVRLNTLMCVRACAKARSTLDALPPSASMMRRWCSSLSASV